MTGSTGPQPDSNKGPQVFPGQSSDIRYLAIGQVIRAHGIRGEISVKVLTDFPERFDTIEWVYLGNEFQAEAYRLESYRWHKQHVLLKLEGVVSRTEAEHLANQFVQVPIEEAVQLPEGEYYLYQLLGLEVVTTTGERLGQITAILETGANDVFVVKQEDQEILLPDIPDVVKKIDLAQGQVIVELIEGLI